MFEVGVLVVLSVGLVVFSLASRLALNYIF